MKCRLTLLGGFALESGNGEELTLPTRKDKLLLAYLALSDGRPQTRQHLAGLLWDHRGETQARNNLKQSLAGMRRVLRQTGVDPLRAGQDPVAFDPEGIEVDAVKFARLATAARAPEQAAAIYRGELLDGFDGVSAEFEDWLCSERKHLSTLAVGVLEQLALSPAPNGASDEAMRLGRHLLVRYRLCEPVYRALMRLHVRKAERSEALKLYAAFREALQQDLGAAPDAKTEELYRDILTNRYSS